jgi:hypothetical protein
MSNPAFLLNTSARGSDIASLRGTWFVAAEADGCIPLPWLCLFAEAELRPCTLAFHETRTVAGVRHELLRKLPILNPSTSVELARIRLSKARPLFVRLAPDAATGEAAWRSALASIEKLPLEYLTLDPTGLLLAGDPKAAAQALATAFGTDDEAVEAKIRLAGLGAQAPRTGVPGGLDGRFHAPHRLPRRSRAPAEAQEALAWLARVDTHTVAKTPGGYEALPFDLRRLEPPEGFWRDEALLAQGGRRARVAHGDCSFMGARKYYATSLTNTSDKPIRVRMFAGFDKTRDGFRLANHTGQWFSAADFIDWYGAPADGWIRPGQTVADPTNWGGDDDGFWAYWCEDEDQGRFIALAHQAPSLSGGQLRTVDGRVRSVSPQPWQPCPDAIRGALEAHVETCRRMAREQGGPALGFDAEAVRWIDDHIEQQHLRGDPGQWQHLVPVFGAFLGECIIRNLGGAWARYDEILCVRSDTDATFPFNGVAKQFANGREGGDSVLGLYQAMLAMRPKPLTGSQQLFAEAFQAHGAEYLFHVAHKPGKDKEWARVLNIEVKGPDGGAWVEIESSVTAGLRHAPRVSVRLDQLMEFKVTDLQGRPAAIDLSPDPSLAPRAEERRPAVPAGPPADAAMQQALERLRTSYLARRASLHERTLEAVRGVPPDWMKPGEALREIFAQQTLLLTQGDIMWAGLVQANNLLFEPGTSDCPAQLVYSRDAWFDGRPKELREIAHTLFSLKNTRPDDPAKRAVADRITNEMDRSMGWRLPREVTPRDVRAATFMVFRKHIPNGVLAAAAFPILAHPSTEAVMIVPFEFWPIELILLWKQKALLF